MVIEDQLDEIRLLPEALRSERFQIIIAFEGMQGYGRAVAPLPDLIQRNVKLDQTDGFAVCRLLMADPSTAHIPVILITSSQRNIASTACRAFAGGCLGLSNSRPSKKCRR